MKKLLKLIPLILLTACNAGYIPVAQPVNLQQMLVKTTTANESQLYITVAESSVVSNLAFNFYNESTCSALRKSIDIEGTATLAAGSYQTSDQANNSLVTFNYNGGWKAESKAKSVNLVYTLSNGSTYGNTSTSNCLYNANQLKENLSDWDTTAKKCIASKCGFSQPYTFDLLAWQPLMVNGIAASLNYLIISESGSLYLAAKRSNSAFGAVMKYNGGTWDFLGESQIYLGADQLSFAVSKANVPYYACASPAVEYRATVRKFSAGEWSNVGIPGFTGSRVAAISVGVDNLDNVYLSYQATESGGKAQVMKYNGTNWQLLSSSLSGNFGGFNTALAIDESNVPYVAFDDGSISGSRLTVKKYNGTSFVLVGAQGFTLQTTSSNSLKISKTGVPYVAFSDFNKGDKLTVMKFNGSAWEYVGTAGISAASVTSVALSISESGIPYVAYTSTNKAKLVQFNGTQWVNVGNTIHTGNSAATSLAIDKAGIPFVAYRDSTNESKDTVKFYPKGGI